MNIVLEVSSVFSWWGIYQSSQINLPKGAVSTAFGGAMAGFSIAALTLPFKNVRQFPETLLERRITPATQNFHSAIKLASCHSLFFLSYTGFREAIYKARQNQRTSPKRDHLDYLNDFLCGGFSGMIYRMGAMAYYKGPVENPMITMAPQLLTKTFLMTGLVCLAFETLGYELKEHFKDALEDMKRN
ncbi:hypothetical protein HK103_007274 [Boothiomyces macroporosus]|uniref:Uncharacterized protein n=1 Tax=Boothiomyces macroporosus TaxID=261099 RepID=A0AAD5Y619_9FUNG|nr:hypothetical protein HK103_007274 [Boothiomyces macroporosus]